MVGIRKNQDEKSRFISYGSKSIVFGELKKLLREVDELKYSAFKMSESEREQFENEQSH